MTRTAETEAAAPARVLEADRSSIEVALREFLDRELASAHAAVAEPIRHAVLAPGKRIRPLLLLAAFRARPDAGAKAEARGMPPEPDRAVARGAAAEPDEAVATLACSVELVHTYSLIHDDLPCMDDDALRRGRPAVHVRFGVDAAVLAGAALMPLAVRAIVAGGRGLGLVEPEVGRLVRELTVAAGGGGMVGGQLLDLRAEGRPVSRAELEEIHLGKTARLIAASCVMGGIAAGGGAAAERRLERFGRTLGLAFQVVDDILDVTGSPLEMGKQGGRDAVLGKATMPSVMGVAEARALGRRLADAALAELSGLSRAEMLREITRVVVDRNN